MVVNVKDTFQFGCKLNFTTSQLAPLVTNMQKLQDSDSLMLSSGPWGLIVVVSAKDIFQFGYKSNFIIS